MHYRRLAILSLIGLLLAGVVPAAWAGGPVSAVTGGLSWFDSGDTWQVSPAVDDCIGPVDGSGRAWTDPKFDASTWTTVQFPDAGSIPPYQDRYYRLGIHLAAASAAEIRLDADDGLTLYANGHLVGTWGATECHGEGLAEGVRVDLSAFLHVGDNTLAIHVSNGPGDSLVHAVLTLRSLAPTKVEPFLDLPYDYRGSSFGVETGSLGQGGRVSAYFDHQSPGSCGGRSCSSSDVRALHFYGYEGDLPAAGEPRFYVYYNGHSGTDFALPAGRPVLAAAAGTVSFAGPVSSICSDGQKRTALVVRVLHPNGYTTEYWHLSAIAEGVDVGTAVSRDPGAPIGYVGSTGCTTGPHLHFAVYTASRSVTDPFAWSPRPDTSWYGRRDPWRGAAGRYLWLQPVAATATMAAGSSAVVYTPSTSARVIVPPEAGPSPLRVDVAEALPSVRIPNQAILYLFSAAAYDSGGAALTALTAQAWVEMRMAGTRLRAISESSLVPTIIRWDAATGSWAPLPTTWDPASRIASAPTDRLGTFALALRTYYTYLPVVSQQSPVVRARPARDRAYYRALSDGRR